MLLLSKLVFKKLFETLLRPTFQPEHDIWGGCVGSEATCTPPKRRVGRDDALPSPLFQPGSKVSACRMLASLLLILTLLGLSSGHAWSQTPERQRAFVYGINAALGTSYVGSFAPPSVDTIYLLADRPSVLSLSLIHI